MIIQPIFATVAVGVTGFLSVCTVIGVMLAWRVETVAARETVANLNARIQSWWGIVAVFGAAVVLGRIVTLVLFAILSFLSLREFVSQMPTRRGDHCTLFLALFFVVPLQYWLIGIGWYGLFSIFIPVCVFLVLPALSAVMGDTNDFLARNSRLLWGLMLTVYAMSYAPALLLLNLPGYALPNALLLLYLTVVVQISDVFQYVFGKLSRARLRGGSSSSHGLAK